MNFDLSRLHRLELRGARVDLLPQVLLDVRALLDDARRERKLEVGRVLVDGVDPAVPDEETLELSRELSRFEDRVGDVRDVLPRVRLACDEGL